MKILVDKMPDRPEECVFSSERGNARGDKWIGCTRAPIVCRDTKECSFFTEFKFNKTTKEK